jgi:hypothetical protein
MFLFIRTNTQNVYNYSFSLHWPTYIFPHKSMYSWYVGLLFFAASLFYPIFRFFPFIPFSNSFFFLHTNIFFSRKFSLIFYSMYNRGLYICTDNIQFIRFLFQFPPLDSAFFCSENETLFRYTGLMLFGLMLDFVIFSPASRRWRLRKVGWRRKSFDITTFFGVFCSFLCPQKKRAKIH